MSELPAVGVDEIAKIFNLDERSIQRLAKQGVIAKAARGQYDLIDCASAYIRHLQTTRPDQKDSHTEKTRLLTAQADRAEMETAQLRGTLVEVADVAEIVDNDYSTVRNRVLGIPSKCAPAVAATSDVREVRAIIEAECLGALEELSNDAIAELEKMDSEIEGNAALRADRSQLI